MKRLIALILLFPLLTGMRPLGTALNQEKMDLITRRFKIRSEVRGANVTVLDINFKDYVSERLVEYLKEAGLAVRDVEITEGMQLGQGQKYDFIFWDAESVERLEMHLGNIFHVLRADGILFLRVFQINGHFSDIEEIALKLQLEIKREGNVLVIKRKFEAWDMFQSVAKELAQIMSVEKAA